MMEIIQIVFWISIGLLYVGVHFRFQEIVIGVCALAVGILQIVSFLRSPR